jgi:hypothetical protein
MAEKDADRRITEEKIIEIADSLFNRKLNVTQAILERVWLRNILYYMGEQWFQWAKENQTFRPVLPSSYTPTPVANIIRDYVRSMKSLILNKDFKIKIWPNSNDQEDMEAAEMGESFLRWLETDNDEEMLDEKEKEAIWMILCGTAFDRTFPYMESDTWAFNSAGIPIKTGDVVSQNVSPFNIAVDNFGEKLTKKRFIGIKSLKPREWVEDTFKVLINEGSGEGPHINYEKMLASLVGNVSPWKGDGLKLTEDATLEDDDLVLFKEIEFRPTKQHPRGIYTAVCGDKVCFRHERLPIPVTSDGKWDYTVTDFHYHYIPGRFWSDPGVNDLISPQNSINQIDQDLEMNRKGVGRPLVTVPTDVNLKRESKDGQAVLVIRYDAMLSGGQAPQITHGVPLPSQVLQERDIHRMASQDAAGDPKNVLRGQAPTSQASGIMVDILRDAAEQGHLPDIERFYRSYKRVKRKQLILAQEVYTEERLIKIPDRGNRVKAIAFKGADLRNNTDVRLELSSGASSTRAGQTQMLLKLTESGFFSTQSDLDPEYRSDILRRLGMAGFKDCRNVDMDRAQTENQLAGRSTDDDLEIAHVWKEPTKEIPEGVDLQMKILPGIFLSIGDVNNDGVQDAEPTVISDDPLYKYDDHAVHYEIHRRYILSAEFRHLDPGIQMVVIGHCDVHKATMDVQMAEEQAKAAFMTGNATRIGTEAARPDMPDMMPEEGVRARPRAVA